MAVGSGTIRGEEDGDDVRRGDEIRRRGGRRRWRPVRSPRSAWLEEAGGEEKMGRRRRGPASAWRRRGGGVGSGAPRSLPRSRWDRGVGERGSGEVGVRVSVGWG